MVFPWSTRALYTFSLYHLQFFHGVANGEPGRGALSEQLMGGASQVDSRQRDLRKVASGSEYGTLHRIQDTRSGFQNTRDDQEAADESSSSPLSFTSSNRYPKITWSPWEHLAEPYKEAVLKADSTAGSVEEDVFLWTIPDENGAVYEGRCVL